MLLAWIISVLSDCNLTITPHKNPYSSRLWPLFRATLFLKVQLCHNWIKIHQSLSVMDIFIESVVCNGSGLHFEGHSYNKCCTNLTSKRWCFGHTRRNTLKTTTFPVLLIWYMNYSSQLISTFPLEFYRRRKYHYCCSRRFQAHYSVTSINNRQTIDNRQ